MTATPPACQQALTGCATCSWRDRPPPAKPLPLPRCAYTHQRQRTPTLHHVSINYCGLPVDLSVARFVTC